MKLYFYPQQQTPPRDGPYGLDGVMLQPGRNELSEIEYRKVSRHPAFPGLVTAGIVTYGESLTEAPEAKPPSASEPVQSPTVTDADLLLFFNASEKSELTDLPEIGPVTAQRIIDGRDYTDLAQVQEASHLVESRWLTVIEALKEIA